MSEQDCEAEGFGQVHFEDSGDYFESSQVNGLPLGSHHALILAFVVLFLEVSVSQLI